MAADRGLQIRHQKRRGHSFAGDVADDETKPAAVQSQKVKVIAAHDPCLNAGAIVIERCERGSLLGEKPGLHLAGDLQLLRGSARDFLAFCLVVAALFDFAGGLVKSSHHKHVAVGVFKAAERPAQDGLLSGMVKWTPRSDHSRYVASMSSVRKVTGEQ